MARFTTTTAFAAALALASTAGMTLPASAYTSSHQRLVSRMHHSPAYRMGYNRGFRDGHYAAATGRVPADLQTGRSAAVEPAPLVAGGQPVFGNGGLLGLGILGGNGLLGTGVLNGRGALGVGILGL